MDQISSSMKSFIPTKLLKAKQSAPWFNNSIKRMCKKKQRLFSAARKTGKPEKKTGKTGWGVGWGGWGVGGGGGGVGVGVGGGVGWGWGWGGGGDVARLAGPNYPQIDPLTIRQKGVEIFLADLDPSKASGPDHIHCRFLKETAHEIGPCVYLYFQAEHCHCHPS